MHNWQAAMANVPIYYWDAVVFISLLTDEETRSQEEKSGIREIIRQIANKEAKLITSVITRGEILKLTSEQEQYLEQFLRRRNCAEVSVDSRIASITKEIRVDHKLKLPDATHLATAIHYEVTALHTYDDDLLKLNGKLIANKYNMVICKPPPPKQLTLL